MSCVTYGNAIICGVGPTKVILRESVGVRWCFQCRERVAFEFTLTAEVEPSYYDPSPSVQCVDRQHWDGDMFPGRHREWE